MRTTEDCAARGRPKNFFLCFLLLLSPASGYPEAAAPVAAYGRLPSLEDVAISPDGNRLAFVKTRGDDRSLGIYEAGKESANGVAKVGEAKLRSLEWADADNLLVTVSQTSAAPLGYTGPKSEAFNLITYNVNRQKLTTLDLYVPNERTFNIIGGQPMIRELNGATSLFIQGYDAAGGFSPALLRYDFAHEVTRVVEKGRAETTHWLLDESGRIAGEFSYRDQQQTWQIYIRRDDRLVQAATGHAAIDLPSLVGFSPDGSSLLVETHDRDEWECKPLSLKDSSWGAPLGPDGCFQRFFIERKSGRVIGGVRRDDDSQYVFYDNERQAHWNAALRAFPGERVRLVSASDDYSRMVLLVFGPAHGYVYALFDWYTHQATVIGKVYEDVSATAEDRPLSYSAADGMVIPAFLTLPPGRAPKDLPLVVLPHGGPAYADAQGFDWWAQALASQGYAVLQPNYRGSTVNPSFMAAGFGEWGRKMQTDLSDGVGFLTKEGIVDPKRVCIVGASYGGYAALAGATLQPEVYRCAVSVAGLSDLGLMLRRTRDRAGLGIVERYWDRFMGASAPDDPRLAQISPILHVGAVTSPILLIHGTDDTVVPYEQSEVMAKALRRAGKSVDFVTLKHEDHWLSHSATRMQMLAATVAFLRANDPP